jgi:hypothetical protein
MKQPKGGSMGARAAVLTLLVAAVAATAAAQGLGDAAAKEKQRRAKAGSKDAAVVTEKDLGKYADEREEASKAAGDAAGAVERPKAVSGTRAESPSSGSSSSDEIFPDRPESDESEAAQRATAEDFKRALGAAEAALQGAEAELAAAQAQWDTVKGHLSHSEGYGVARNRLERAQAGVQQARQHRDSIMDAARRARIPPGWLR